MGRSIKFRAWDKEREEMLPVTKMDWPEWWVSCEPIVDDVLHPLDYGERNSFKNENTDRHILMQYTGLYDRHGDKAAHKDIVEYEGMNYLIEWWEEDTGFYLAHLNHLDDLESEYHLKGQCIRESEIIGNAFEHPHLLTKEEEQT